MNWGELTYISNLVSLSRVAMVPLVAIYLKQNDLTSAYICLTLIVLAGLSDALDGYLARKFNQVSQTGLILDPLADKVFALSLIVMLIFYREFSLYLAASILFRDLLILSAGLLFLKEKIVVPSNNIGKYYFAALVTLISCSVLRFETGIFLTSRIVIFLLLFSILSYAILAIEIKYKKKIFSFPDNKAVLAIRVTLTYLTAFYLFYNLYLVHDTLFPAP